MWRKSNRTLESQSGAATLLRRLRKDNEGATAIEFAMVAGPFLMLLFGIIGVGLFFFTTFSLENSVETAARQLRTGALQQSGSSDPASDFKTAVCSSLPGFITCSEVTTNVLSFSNYAAITANSIPSCTNAAGALATPVFTPGQQNAVVVAWACYKWKVAKDIPFINLGNQGDGSRLIQATTTFQTEPYQ